MDYPRLAARLEDTVRFPKQEVRPLGVQYVEEHGVVDAAVIQPGAVPDKIAQDGGDIDEASILRLALHQLDEARLDVQRDNLARYGLGRRNGEGSITAAELDDVADVRIYGEGSSTFGASKKEAHRRSSGIPLSLIFMTGAIHIVQGLSALRRRPLRTTMTER